MRRSLPLLVALLGLAAFLRFTGLTWGLRHEPFPDERLFVEPTRQMLQQGRYDPGYYEYPGLPFWLLRAALLALSPEAREGPAAYAAARAVVATAGVASVGLVFLLGRRLIGVRAGLVAALLLAVSPTEVTTAHMFRPDVLLGSFVLLGLLAFTRLGERLRDDVAAGLALGLALAVKFSGAALGPAWLLARSLAAGPRARGVVAGGLAAALVVLATTPQVVTAPSLVEAGMSSQSAHFYDPSKRASEPSLLYYLRNIGRSAGPVGSGLAIVGLVAVARSPHWLPALLYATLLLGVLSSANERWERLIASLLGIVALLSARGLESVCARYRWAFLPLATLAAVPPALESFDCAVTLSQPIARDLVLDWIDAELRPGSRVLISTPDLGINRFRFDVAGFTGVPGLDALAARRADAVVVGTHEAWPGTEGLPREFTAQPRNDWGGFPLSVLRPPRSERPLLEPLPAAEVRRAAGADPARIEITLAAPRSVACVELRFRSRATRRFGLLARDEDGAGWLPVPIVVGAGCAEDPRPGASTRSLLFEPRRTTALRVTREQKNPPDLEEVLAFTLTDPPSGAPR